MKCILFNLQFYCEKFLLFFTDRINQTEYLFEGYKYDSISSKTIVNYFTTIKEKFNLDETISYHSLRHSFASNFIKAGGDVFILKSMMGHTSLNTTNIYIHIGRDFNNLKGVNYDGI